MVELTPEEKEKIYLEEKQRIEEERKRNRVSMQTPLGYSLVLFGALFLIGGLFMKWTILFLFPTSGFELPLGILIFIFALATTVFCLIGHTTKKDFGVMIVISSVLSVIFLILAALRLPIVFMGFWVSVLGGLILILGSVFIGKKILANIFRDRKASTNSLKSVFIVAFLMLIILVLTVFLFISYSGKLPERNPKTSIVKEESKPAVIQKQKEKEIIMKESSREAKNRERESKAIVVDVEKKPEPVRSLESRSISVIMSNGRSWDTDKIIMINIPAGEFIMGDSLGEVDEQPAHRVVLKSFWIGKYEVTFDQYDIFCNDTGRIPPSSKGWGRGHYPVINVSWYDAAAYCQWLSQKTGYNFHLPSEAQWEYACRAGTKTAFFWGNTAELACQYANVADYEGQRQMVLLNIINCNDHWAHTAPVGCFKPNPFGLYDMIGNVWEICADWYDEKYYQNSPVNDPAGPESGDQKVCRGGSWFCDMHRIRVAVRSSVLPTLRDGVGGFRLCMD